MTNNQQIETSTIVFDDSQQGTAGVEYTVVTARANQKDGHAVTDMRAHAGQQRKP